jgi:hypothetical protein
VAVGSSAAAWHGDSGINDPRYQAQGFSLSLSQPSAPPLFVKPGATVSGRLVTADQLPVVNVLIYSRGENVEETRTDAEGRFTVSGLPPGHLFLDVFDFVTPAGKPRKRKITSSQVSKSRI